MHKHDNISKIMITLKQTASETARNQYTTMATEPQKTVTINGHEYDAITGMPVGSAPKKSAPKATKPVSKPSLKSDVKPVAKKTAKRTASADVHASGPQRSQALNRRVARKTSTVARPAKVGRHMDIARSGSVTRFAPHDHIGPEVSASRPVADKAASVHPIVQRAIERPAHARAPHPHSHVVPQPQTRVQPATSQEIKNAAIATALAKEPTTTPHTPHKKKSRRKKTLLIVLISIIIVLGAAYVTFMNLPVLSVNLASAQAGIKATYPSYTPDGYTLEQPITFNEGEITLRFDSNSSEGGYIIKQERSSWDSSAVLTNIVKKVAGDEYTVTQDSGLTIYTFKGNAVWVNRGLLFTITNNDKLSNAQVNDIATSL